MRHTWQTIQDSLFERMKEVLRQWFAGGMKEAALLKQTWASSKTV